MQASDLIGAWTVESFVGRSSSGEERRPFGDDPVGHILYSASGHMAVVMARRGRPHFASSDFAGGTDAEIRKAYAGLEAYTGTFSVDAAAGTVTHQLEVARYPNWDGVAQLRYARQVGDRLELSTPPMRAGGRDWVYTLVWRRAAPAATG